MTNKENNNDNKSNTEEYTNTTITNSDNDKPESGIYNAKKQ